MRDPGGVQAPFTALYDFASWPDQEEPALDEFQAHPPTTCRSCSSDATRGVVCWTDHGDHHYDIRQIEPICDSDGHASRSEFSLVFLASDGQWTRITGRRVLHQPRADGTHDEPPFAG